MHSIDGAEPGNFYQAVKELVPFDLAHDVRTLLRRATDAHAVIRRLSRHSGGGDPKGSAVRPVTGRVADSDEVQSIRSPDRVCEDEVSPVRVTGWCTPACVPLCASDVCGCVWVPVGV